MPLLQGSDGNPSLIDFNCRVCSLPHTLEKFFGVFFWFGAFFQTPSRTMASHIFLQNPSSSSQRPFKRPNVARLRLRNVFSCCFYQFLFLK